MMSTRSRGACAVLLKLTKQAFTMSIRWLNGIVVVATCRYVLLLQIDVMSNGPMSTSMTAEQLIWPRILLTLLFL